MTLRGWSVLLILYVAADFANPLMPEAVTFLDGSVQAVHVERARLAEVPSAPAVVPSPGGGIEAGRLTRDIPPPMLSASIARFWQTSARHAPLAGSDPSPSPPSEDH